MIQDLLYLLGRVFDPNGQEKEICMILKPPLSINRTLYRCDKRFHTDDIRKLYEKYEEWGIVLISGELVEFYRLKGTEHKKIDKISMDKQKGHKKGGQSAQRFNRIHDNQEKEFIKKTCSEFSKHYMLSDDSFPNVKGLIIAGMGETKNNIINSGLLNPKLQNIIRKSITISCFDINRIIQSSQDIISDVNIQEERNHILFLQDLISHSPDLVEYGVDRLKYLISSGLIQKLYIHQESLSKLDHTLRDYLLSSSIHLIVLHSYIDEIVLFLHGYGGLIGLLYYPINKYDIENDISE